VATERDTKGDWLERVELQWSKWRKSWAQVTALKMVACIRRADDVIAAYQEWGQNPPDEVKSALRAWQQTREGRGD